ncbi:MFS transporter [Paraburkholderia kururiensis]|uniref:MFS transporter n=1 Tax=Paraburkholderia kururiensis TaxID=984307 RepID=A0ABZ0WGS6_9BURK|nr:MFS transporter [Paraburkholderia kururiensis]WQD76575.1 MFS transporter [Paraburkholderia kururiensis]
MNGNLARGAASGRNHRWKVLGVGFAANASFAAAFSGIPTTAVLLRGAYGIGNGGLGLVLGMLGLGIALSELPWGLLTDRWGDRRVLLLGLGGTAAALVGMALFVVPRADHVPALVTLAAGLLLVGLLGGSVNGSSGRAVMAWFKEGERGLAMSIRQTAVPAGGGLGALMLPALATSYGFAAVYGVLAVLCAVTAGFAWRWLYEPEHAAGGAASTRTGGQIPATPSTNSPASAHAPKTPLRPHPAHARAAASPLRDPAIWRVTLGIAALCVPQLAVVTFAAVFLHDFSHAGVVAISVTMAAVQTGAAVMRVWSGRWTDRHGNRRGYMRACSLLTAALFALLAAMTLAVPHAGSTAIALFAVAIVLGGVSASAWHGVAYTELATLAGTQRAGTALAMGNTGAFTTLFLTPLAIPPLLAVGSWTAVWAAASVCALLALPVFPRAHRVKMGAVSAAN